MLDIPVAKLVLLKDVNKCKRGDTVRVTGYWKKYDAGIDLGVIQYDTYQVEIDMKQTEKIIPAEGDTVQCIGEIINETKDVRICARIIRLVYSLDMELYEKIVQIRNTIA
ncbi:telomere-capping, CST complex subunit-domain-containing protein [Pilaira anomala]|nr:telomere-capping, CST complex subunit-domain-containing protein [Pilaira anomala]